MSLGAQIWDALSSSIAANLPGVLTAILILVAGWVAALAVRFVLRKGLGVVGLNRFVKRSTGSDLDAEQGLAKVGFFVVMAMALSAFFGALELDIVSEPLGALVDEVLGFLPNLMVGGVLALVAWAVATGVSKGATSALASTRLDDKLSTGAGATPISNSLGDVLYWVILLLFLPAILGALQLQGLLGPVQSMVDQILTMVPNVFAAAALGAVGWFLASLLRNVITSLLSAVGVDTLGERAGLKGTMPLSRLIGLLVFVFVFVPTLVAALDALRIEAISGPATQMLTAMMAAIPKILSAGIVLGIAFFISRFASDVISNLLGGIGFDALPARLGIQALPEGAPPSRMVGRAVVFFIMLFATVEAASMLGFSQMSAIVAMMIEFGGHVLLGVTIIAVGLWIANLAHGALIRQAGSNATLYAGLARIAILGVVFAMGLDAMQLADEIVKWAFVLTIGAVATAVALSFGLGGREPAGRQMEHWLSALRGERSSAS